MDLVRDTFETSHLENILNGEHNPIRCVQHLLNDIRNGESDDLPQEIEKSHDADWDKRRSRDHSYCLNVCMRKITTRKFGELVCC